MGNASKTYTVSLVLPYITMKHSMYVLYMVSESLYAQKCLIYTFNYRKDVNG